MPTSGILNFQGHNVLLLKKSKWIYCKSVNDILNNIFGNKSGFFFSNHTYKLL